MLSLLILERQQKDFLKFISNSHITLASLFIWNGNDKFVHTLPYSLKNDTRIQTKIGKIYTRFLTKTAQKPHPLGRHLPIRHIQRNTSPSPPPPTHTHTSSPTPDLRHLMFSNALGNMQFSQEHLKTTVHAKFGDQAVIYYEGFENRTLVIPSLSHHAACNRMQLFMQPNLT